MAISWTKTPKGYVILALAAFLIIASIGTQDIKGIVNAVVAVCVSAGAEFLCGQLAKRKKAIPYGAVITGLIISLILGTTENWTMVAAASLLSIVPKYLLVHKKKPIFNPAALGLMLSVLFFHTEQSWWGAFGDLPAWTIVFLLIGGYYVTDRVNKYAQVFSFLGTFFVLLLVMGMLHLGDAADALRPPFINAALFFALFMLTDPPTTPAKTKEQIIFGILTAVISAVVYGIFGGLMYLFIGLLAANAYRIIPLTDAGTTSSRRSATGR